MTTYAFHARPVIDPDAPAGSSLVKGATFQFYAYSDTTYSTPLTVTARIAGVPTAASTMTSTDEGLLDEFSVEDQWRVWAKSGTHAVLMESTQGLAESATAAQAAALGAQAAAEVAADAAAAAVIPTNAAIDARIVNKADLDPATGKLIATQMPTVSASDATTTSKGSIQLAGDLGGTASAPIVLGKASDSAVVHNTGAETVAGVKTFTSAPVVPDSSFTPAKLNVSATVKSMLSAADAAGARTAIDVAAEITAARGAASGVAPLDSGSRVPDANLPTRLSDGSLHDAFAPVSQALWIPAGQFDIGEGIPTFSTINSNQSWGWMLDDATSEGGTTLLTVPGHWSQITGIEVWWCPLTAAGGNVVWAGAVYNLAHGGSLQASGSALTNLGTSTAGTTAYTVRVQASGTISLAVDPAKVQRLFVRRSGGNASDTYVGDVAFLGVKVIGS